MKNIGFFLEVLLIISLFSRLVSFAFAQNDYPTTDFEMQLELNKTQLDKVKQEVLNKNEELKQLDDKLKALESASSSQVIEVSTLIEKLRLQAQDNVLQTAELNLLKDKLTRALAEKEQALKQLETRDKLTQANQELQAKEQAPKQLETSAYHFDFRDVDLELRASASEGYDSNITQAHQNEKQDAVTNLSVSLGAKYEGKTRSAELAAKITQQIFARYSEFNKNSQELTLDGLQELSKYDRVTLKDAFSHTYEPLTFEETFGRETGWYSHYRNGFNLGYTRDITRQASASVRYANEVVSR